MKCEALHQEIETQRNQKRTIIVVLITVIMMIAEISAGLVFGSIALLSDGIHMGTHTLALMITVIAYVLARKHSSNYRFTFGTGKISVLGGYTSAIVLIIASGLMTWEAVMRFFNPVQIEYNQSMLVAVIGLIVNVISAILLREDHDHHHHSGCEHHHHEDHNLKAAYLHVLADALTSVCAIVALLGAKYYNLVWLDPVVGIAGAIVVIKWGIGLLGSTGKILVDYSDDESLKEKIINSLENEGVKLIDLHIWDVLNGKKAVICSLDCHDKEKVENLRKIILKNEIINHLTIEIK